MTVDLDKSGHGFQQARTYLGPSLGWKDIFVQPTVEITTPGAYAVKPGDQLLLVDVAGFVTIHLPDVTKWIQQPADQPATGFDRSITIKDLGGNAANFNIVVAPFQQQAIDNIQQSIVISTARASVKLIPLIDMTGWALEMASVSGGGGGGDVFKAGNNTFTGINTFTSLTIVPTKPPGDNTDEAASTKFVKDQNYITGAALLPYALLDSPVFINDPRAPTPSLSDNDTTIATTAFVQGVVGAIPVPAPVTGEYVTASINPTLTNERVLTNTASIVWDFTTPGQAKANTVAGGGNVSNVGTPTAGQLARWTTATTIEGVSLAAAGIQPLDGDLTAISALTGTNTIYYRSATDIWSPVTFSGLSFSGGVLSVTAGGGNVNNVGTPVDNQLAVWTTSTTIEGDARLTWTGAGLVVGNVSTQNALIIAPNAAGNFPYLQALGIDANIGINYTTKGTQYHGFYTNNFGNLQAVIIHQAVAGYLQFGGGDGAVNIALSGGASGNKVSIVNANLTGTPTAPTPAPGDNDTSVATTAFVTAAIAAAPGGVKLAFSAAPSADQTGIADSVWTKVNFATSVFADAAVGYNAGLSRWTPPAGNVQMKAAVYCNTTLPGTPLFIAIYKNGALFRHVANASVSSNQASALIEIIDKANGTDFYEVYMFGNTNTTITLYGPPTIGTFFMGSQI